MFFPSLGEITFLTHLENTNKKLREKNKDLAQRVKELELAVKLVHSGNKTPTTVEDFVLQQSFCESFVLNKLDNEGLVKCLSAAIEKRLGVKP